MKDKETPLALVRAVDKKYPGIYQQLDNCRRAKAEGRMQWHDACLLPINAGFTALVYGYGADITEAAEKAAEVTACYIWRRNKVIYAFDGTFASELAAQAEDMEETDTLPTDLLLHMPYPCIYAKCPGVLDELCDGFFAWIDSDVNTGALEFRVQHVTTDFGYSAPSVLHLVPGGTIADCISDTNKEIAKHTDNPDIALRISDAKMLFGALQIVLYLVSTDGDVAQRPTDKPAPKKARTGKPKITDKAGEIAVYDVGVRIGSAFRRYASGKTTTDTVDTGTSKRPHSRRGHWHHYWTGPMAKPEERKLILKWTAPTFIHADKISGEEVPVIYPVKSEKK